MARVNNSDLLSDIYYGAISPSVVIQNEPLKFLVRRFERQLTELTAKEIDMEGRLLSVSDEDGDPILQEVQLVTLPQWPGWAGTLKTEQLTKGPHEIILSLGQTQESFETSLDITVVESDELEKALLYEKEQSHIDRDTPIRLIAEVDQTLHEAIKWLRHAQEWNYHGISIRLPHVDHQILLPAGEWPGFTTPASAFSWIFRTAASIAYDLCFYGGAVGVEHGVVSPVYMVRFDISSLTPIEIRGTHSIPAGIMGELPGVQTFKVSYVEERRAQILIEFLPS